MNEEIKSFSIKLLLTIPALVLGIFACLLVLFKPLITLWYPAYFEESILPEIRSKAPEMPPVVPPQE